VLTEAVAVLAPGLIGRGPQVCGFAHVDGSLEPVRIAAMARVQISSVPDVVAPGPGGQADPRAHWAGEYLATHECSRAAPTSPSDPGPARFPQAMGRRQRPGPRASRERRELALATLVSLLIHALLLSLTFGGEGIGLPGLSFPWRDRRGTVPDLHIVLVPARVTPADPAVKSAADPSRRASIERPVGGGPPPTPASPALHPRGRAVANVPTAEPTAQVLEAKRNAVPAAAPVKAPMRAKEPDRAAPPRIVEPAAVGAEPSDAPRSLVRAPTLTSPTSVIAVAPSASSPDTVTSMSGDAGDAAREAQRLEVARREADRAEAARLEAERQEAARQAGAQLEAQRHEADRQEAARVEVARLEAERQEEAARLAAAQLEAQRQEDARREAAHAEAARLEAERQEAARQAAAQSEAQRQEAARQETARIEAARLEAERQEQAARLAAARLEAQWQEAQREEAARREAARAEAARLDAERQETARQAAAQLEAQRQEAARQEAGRAETARLEAERQAAARQAAAQLEAQRQEAAQQAAAQLEAQRKEAARQEAARAETARLEAEHQEVARQAAAQLEAQRQEAARQEAARAETARLEAERQEVARLATAREEALRIEVEQREARREATLRAIGRQLDEEAARRDAASTAARPPSTLPYSLSTARRVRLWGHTHPNVELVQYAQAWALKVQLNTPVETVREVAKRPRRTPMVTVAIRSDGSVESVIFDVSSGVAEVDEAIRRIVESHRPYPPFSPALAREVDVIEIRRTWYFDVAVRLH
jgi:hypothetical protein